MGTYANFVPDAQPSVPAGEPTQSPGSYPTFAPTPDPNEDLKKPSFGRRAAQVGETALDIGGYMAGAGLGGAAGGTLMPFGGEVVGAMAGGAAASVLTDQLNHHINNYLFGDPIPDPAAAGTLPGFNRPYGGMEQTAAIGGALEGAGRAIPMVASGIFGVRSATDIARDAFAKTSTENVLAQDVESTAGVEARDLFRAKAEDVESKAAEKAERGAQSELSQREQAELKKMKAEKQTAIAEAKKVHAAEAEKARGELLGRTAEETEAAVAPKSEGGRPSAAELERKAAFSGSIYDQHDAIEEGYGKEYNDFEKNYHDKHIPTRAMDQEGRLNNVLGEIQARSPASTSAMPLSDKMKALIKEAEDTVAGKSYLSHKDPVTGLVALEEIQTVEGPTVKAMRELRRRAQRDAATLPTDTEKDMATRIASGADKSLEGADGVPKDAIDALRKTNTEYHDFKQHFNRQFMREVANQTEPTDLFNQLFIDDHKRMGRLLDTATPEQREVYRNMFADYANLKNWKLSDIGKLMKENKLSKSVLQNLYGDKFTKALPYIKNGLDDLHSAVATRPSFAAEYGQTLAKHVAAGTKDTANKLRPMLLQVAHAMGKGGEALRGELRNALKPEEVMAAAGKIANMNKADFVKAIASTQKEPVLSAKEALMTMKPGRLGGWLQRLTAIRGLFYSSGIAAGLLAGHVSPSLIGLATMDGVLSLGLGARSLGRSVLRHEGIASIVADIATTDAKLNRAKFLANRTSDLISALARQKAKEKIDKQEQAERP
jgi:hypothetical protein